jgi:glycosyltransferase involved in cell wall biosynthesis
LTVTADFVCCRIYAFGLRERGCQKYVTDRSSEVREVFRVMFLYWGRRGFSRFAFDVGRAAVADPDVTATVSVARQNENFDCFRQAGFRLFPVDTFHTNLGALTQLWRISQLRQRLVDCLQHDSIEAVIDLMPHIWSPAMTLAIRRAGIPYLCVIHDAAPHPGDQTGRAKILIDCALRNASHVLTLSKTTAGRLIAMGKAPAGKITALFHPDLSYGARSNPRRRRPGERIRLLFMGRIMRYKGLPLFLDAIDLLRAEGVAVEAGIFGEGRLGRSAGRLAGMGIEVVNRWLNDGEISAVLSRFDALVASHIEASQSGVVAAALGAGLPVVATPVGGLVEQITDGVTGTVARRADARSLADGVKRLFSPDLYHSVCESIIQTKGQRSMARFVRECVRTAADICVSTELRVSRRPVAEECLIKAPGTQ